jgi:TldD protein
MSQSRRKFLRQMSAAAALGLVGQIPGRQLWAATPAEMLPEPDEALLRELALKAIDAARRAGASFADVRVASGCSAGVSCQWVRSSGKPPQMRAPSITLMSGYGIRAMVGGAWGFSSGYELNIDAVTRATLSAVARAKANRPRHRKTLDLAPVSALESGRWVSPIEQDPFLVPFGHQAELQIAAITAVMPFPEILGANSAFGWRRIEQVFACTDGRIQFQQRYLGGPGLGVVAQVGDIYTRAGDGPDLPRTGGFENVTRSDLVSGIREAAVRAVAESRKLGPPRSVELGRYDIVFGAAAAARHMADTIGMAVNLERALGFQANKAGTSYAAPPAEILGRYRVASPLLTVRANRSRPGGNATVKWDAEGVKPEDYTVVQDGVIVDYHTSRETAPALATWYKAHGKPVRSHGCMEGVGQGLPRVNMPNLSIEPGKGSATLDDLIADTKHGIYLVGYAEGDTDQQLLNSQFSSNYRQAREITNGKLGARLDDVAYQFGTPTFWKSLDALGGPNSRSLVTVSGGPHRFEPLQLDASSVESVPIRVRNVNVLNTGRKT